MAYQGVNIRQVLPLILALRGNQATGSLNQSDPSVATASTTGQGSAAVTPEQQKILEGANAPSLAPQRAAAQEQRILESQNPQMAQQNQQQQQAQNVPGGQPQQSALGNFSQEQQQQGQQNAQTASEKGFWDTIGSGLTGEGLQGEELAAWRKNMALGTMLGQLGSAIGGNTTGGRLAEGTYQLGAGNMAAKNAELRDQRQDEFTRAVTSALAGRMPSTQAATQNQTQGSTLGRSQVSQPQTTPNGEPSLNGDMQGLIDDLDVQLERLRRLGQTI